MSMHITANQMTSNASKAYTIVKNWKLNFFFKKFPKFNISDKAKLYNFKIQALWNNFISHLQEYFREFSGQNFVQCRQRGKRIFFLTLSAQAFYAIGILQSRHNVQQVLTTIKSNDGVCFKSKLVCVYVAIQPFLSNLAHLRASVLACFNHFYACSFTVIPCVLQIF
jgi:hypothetical protein